MVVFLVWNTNILFSHPRDNTASGYLVKVVTMTTVSTLIFVLGSLSTRS